MEDTVNVYSALPTVPLKTTTTRPPALINSDVKGPCLQSLFLHGYGSLDTYNLDTHVEPDTSHENPPS